MNKISIALSLAALLMVGCTDKEEKQSAQTTDSVKESAVNQAPQNLYGTSVEQEAVGAPQDTDSQAIAQNVQHVAKVLETVDAAGYTYAKVEENGDVYWIAGPKTSIAPGSTISFIEQMVMENFTSKALNKTFDYLVFASAIISTNGKGEAVAPAMQKEHDCDTCDTPKVIEPVPAAHTSTPAKTSTEIQTVKVSKNKTGYSVEELYIKSSELEGKSVKVNAKVVKVSKNIMGKDWIHLQDGTGSDGTSDIIATAVNSTVSVGDTITVNGVLKTNVDLGYGYKFSAMIEEAKFSALN